MIVSTEDPQGRYVRYAAPAPVEPDERVELRDTSDEDRRLHELCEDWAYWCHTRRYLGAPKPLNTNSIARWAAPMRATASVGRDGPVTLNTAADAAQALAPVAGPWASAVFAIGFIATGVLLLRVT